MPGPTSIRSQLPHLSFGQGTSYSSNAGSGPPSPTLTASTSASNAFPSGTGPRVVVTRADLKQSMTAYETLLSSAKAYRNALLALATATSSFAVALEDCARQKGAAAGIEEQPGHSASDRLMAAAGLHHIAGNHTQLLADSLYKNFEIPLLEEFDAHRSAVAERQAAYEKQVQAKTKAIRDTEAANMRAGRKKSRDLSHFRRALAQLQTQVDDLDRMKFTYYNELLDGQQETWELIADKTAIVIRSEHELYDRVASKATADIVLDGMVQSVPDPFGEFERPEDGLNGNRIFSILTPMSFSPSPAAALSRTVTPPSNPSPRPDHASPPSSLERTQSRGSTASASGYDTALSETPRRPSRAERADLSVVDERDSASESTVEPDKAVDVDELDGER